MNGKEYQDLAIRTCSIPYDQKEYCKCSVRPYIRSGRGRRHHAEGVPGSSFRQGTFEEGTG